MVAAGSGQGSGVPGCPASPTRGSRRCFQPGFSLWLGQSGSSPAEEPSTGQGLPEPCGTVVSPWPPPRSGLCPAVPAGPQPPGSGAVPAGPQPPGIRCCPESPARRAGVWSLCVPIMRKNPSDSGHAEAPGPGPGEAASGGEWDPQGIPRAPPGYPQSGLGPVRTPGGAGGPRPDPTGTPTRSWGWGSRPGELWGPLPCPAPAAQLRSGPPGAPCPPGNPNTRSLGELLPGRSGTALIPADLHSSIVSQGPM